MFIARLTISMIYKSCVRTFKDVMKSWGMEEEVHYRINTQKNFITFWNDSLIDLIELSPSSSDPEYSGLGSSEYSGGYFEEISEIPEKGLIVLTSRIRYKVAETTVVSKALYSTNPCLGYVRSRWVQDDDGNPAVLANGDCYIPFTLFDNPSASFRASYLPQLMRIPDRATRERLLYGNWTFIDGNDMAAYHSFNGEVHLISGLKESSYDPLIPIALLWDFNVAPYMSVLAMQFDYANKEVHILEEILGKPEDKTNSTPAMAKKIAQKYLSEGHLGGIVISGDPSGAARSTQTEEGVNNYTIIMNEMRAPQLHASLKLLQKQPAQVQRLEFVNKLFEGFNEWSIKIDVRCRKLTEDLVYQRKNQDGTKEKKKVLDPKLKIKFERYGHLSDCLDYGLCMFLGDDFTKFKKSNTQVGVYTSDSSDIYDNNQFDW